MTYQRMDCRCCRGRNLSEAFNLGEQPYANAYLTESQLTDPETKCPLVLKECQDCGQVQLSHVVDPNVLYRDYPFQTSSSQRMAAHFADLMATHVFRFVRQGGLVVEIGSNDGTALSSIERRDVRRLGVDPASNLTAIAQEKGVPSMAVFFGEQTAKDIFAIQGQADLIVACNVLAHIDDLDDFCKGVAVLLSDDGALVVEVPHVRCLVENGEFDTIYHEHLSYFSERPLATLFQRHGLCVEDVAAQSVHGGSMRLIVRRIESVEPSLSTQEASTVDWQGFNHRVQTQCANLRDWLIEMRGSGHVVWGYGAPAKGTVLLNYCGIGVDLLPVVVDSTSTKQGRYVPGTHQPIMAPENVMSWRPDALLVLAWNHAKEIAAKEAEYVAQGGMMVVPSLNNLKE